MPDPSQLIALRQTAAELLACALCDLFPNTQLVDSKITDVGFSYDVILTQQLDESSLPLIEDRMNAIKRQNYPIRYLEMMRQNASEFFQHHNQEIRAQALSAGHQQVVTVFKMGDFIDICTNPFLESPAEVKAFKLFDINQIKKSIPGGGILKVTRFTGTAFPDSFSLKRYIKRREEAKNRDHRQIVQEMELCSPYEESGCWIWQPKGMTLRSLLLEAERRLQGGQRVQPLSLPILIPKGKSRGDSPSLKLDGADYVLCPDPAPFFAALASKQNISFLQLPVYYGASIPGCRTHLPSGDMDGLFHSRTFEINTTQIFCTSEQLADELTSSLQFIDKCIKILGFEAEWYIDESFPRNLKNKEEWKKGIDDLKGAASRCGLQYVLDKQGKTLYGPGVEVRLADALGRYWQGPFVTLNTVHPDAFDLRYQKTDGTLHRLKMITRSVFGPLDRFIAVLIEQTAGILPLWLSPEQIRIIPVNADNANYAANILSAIEQAGFRGSIDFRLEPLGEKVHTAERARVPYIVIVGDKENKKGVIAVRTRDTTQVKQDVTIQSFLEDLQQAVNQENTKL